LLNDLRGRLTEIDVIAAQGPRYTANWPIASRRVTRRCRWSCEALAPLAVQLRNLDEAIARCDRVIAKMAQKDETARRPRSIPGFGPIVASARLANVQDASGFAGPREFAAFLELTPRQNSLGGKKRLGRISKVGNRYLRMLLVLGAHAVLSSQNTHRPAVDVG
jgi:transposase